MNDQSPNPAKVVVVTNEVPNREHSTVTYMTRMILDALVEGGFQPHCLAIIPENDDPSRDRDRERRLRALKGDGVAAETMRLRPEDRKGLPREVFDGLRLRRKIFLWRYWWMRLQRLLEPPAEEYFPETAHAAAIREKIASHGPDLVISFADFGTTYAAAGLPIPVFSILGDPDHLPGLYRMLPPFRSWTFAFSREFRRTVWHLWQKRRAFLRLVRQIREPHLTAAHHAAWLKRQGIRDARYIRNLVPDWGGASWRRERDASPPRLGFRILLMGHVTGTATRAGLYCLADLLPELDRRLGGGFEAHICGKGEIPAGLRMRLAHPAVTFRGFVDDIVPELRSADVFLVPTPVPLGIRVRIAYAWSIGCCVVAHSANAHGLAELRNGDNALVGSNASEIAAAIARLATSPDLRRQIEDGGRRTFETYYAPFVRTAAFLREIEDFRLSA